MWIDVEGKTNSSLRIGEFIVLISFKLHGKQAIIPILKTGIL